jgi:hypothetical protein
MANLVRIFSKKMSSKNPEVDLDLIIKALLESQQKDDEDDEYTHKVHLSDVMKEIKFQVRRHDTSQDTAGPPSKLALYRYPLHRAMLPARALRARTTLAHSVAN